MINFHYTFSLVLIFNKYMLKIEILTKNIKKDKFNLQIYPYPRFSQPLQEHQLQPHSHRHP